MKNDQGWFDHEQSEWARRQRGEWPPVISVQELMNIPETPEWFVRECEYHYRKGFYHGIAEAAELIGRLYRGGYQRPSEIANMLGDWCNDLRRWKGRAITESPLNDHGTPRMPWTPWPELRAKVFERDGACVQCDSIEDLQAHHVDPVKDGGLPALENLMTLCLLCHRRKAG